MGKQGKVETVEESSGPEVVSSCDSKAEKKAMHDGEGKKRSVPGAIPVARPPKGSSKLAAFRDKFCDDIPSANDDLADGTVPGAMIFPGPPPDRQQGGRTKQDAFRNKFSGSDQLHSNSTEMASVVDATAMVGSTPVARKDKLAMGKFAADTETARVEEVGVSMAPHNTSSDGGYHAKSKKEVPSSSKEGPMLIRSDSASEEPPTPPSSPLARSHQFSQQNILGEGGQQGIAGVDTSLPTQDLAASMGIGQVPVSFRKASDSTLGGEAPPTGPYGDIMAEAFLVEETDDDSSGEDLDDVEIGNDGLPTGQDQPTKPMVAVATAKKVSPIIRFAQEHCVLVCAALLLLIGGIAGISAYLATRNSPTVVVAGTFEPTPEPTPEPSFAPTVSSLPSYIPSLSPTNAPTSPCNMSPDDRSAAIVEEVTTLISSQESVATSDTSSPLSQAVAWIANEDGLLPQLCPGRDAIRLMQRFGLALLHFSTNQDAEGWNLQPSEQSMGFLSEINECDWAGVGCDSDTNTVTSIRLGGRNLKGELPLELWAIFDSLSTLSLENNFIYGSIPEHIANLTTLEFLYLQNNRITGVLTESIGSLSELQEINLAGNSIVGTLPPSILDLTSLTLLDLSRNEMTGDLYFLSGHISQQRRYLSTNDDDGPTMDSSRLPNLGTLDLSSNSFSGTMPAYFPPSLSSLSLALNNLNGSLSAAIYDLPHLEELHLHHNMLSGEIESEIGDLTKLRSLSLSNCDFNGTLPERLGELASLEFLRLDANPRLGGQIPVPLLQLGNITLLSIQGTDLVGNVSDSVCALEGEEAGGGGNLERLIATCDDSGGICDPLSSICCSCCDCREAQPTIVVPPPDRTCNHYGFDESESELFSDNRTEQIYALLPIASPDFLLSQNSSAQARAAEWLIDEDPFFLNFDPSNTSDLLLRYSLAVLYFATNGDDWAQCSAHENQDSSTCGMGRFAGKERFLSDVSACEWAGITCEGDYVSIELDRNGLRGEVPFQELGGLCLDSMSLRGNQGIVVNYESVYFLDNLRRLDLSENALTGTFGREGEPGDLLALPILELRLADNLFSGTLPDFIRQNVLDLSGNLLTGSIPSFFPYYEEEPRFGGLDEELEFVEFEEEFFFEEFERDIPTTPAALLLHNNLFNGTVPEVISQFYGLETLTLQNNDFSGSMPDPVCDLTFRNGGQLENLWADCANGVNAQVFCVCCTKCFE